MSEFKIKIEWRCTFKIFAKIHPAEKLQNLRKLHKVEYWKLKVLLSIISYYTYRMRYRYTNRNVTLVSFRCKINYQCKNMYSKNVSINIIKLQITRPQKFLWYNLIHFFKVLWPLKTALVTSFGLQFSIPLVIPRIIGCETTFEVPYNFLDMKFFHFVVNSKLYLESFVDLEQVERGWKLQFENAINMLLWAHTARNEYILSHY